MYHQRARHGRHGHLQLRINLTQLNSQDGSPSPASWKNANQVVAWRKGQRWLILFVECAALRGTALLSLLGIAPTIAWFAPDSCDWILGQSWFDIVSDRVLVHPLSLDRSHI